MEALARRWGPRLGKALLLLASLAIVFCLLEFVVLPRLLVSPPHRLQQRFTPLMQVLSQHSKSGLVPRDYVLLVGDSWAKGFGEWLARADPDGNAPYHSADVIQDRLGRDVLSYGHGGAGSIAGFALMPARWDRALAGYGAEPPQTVVAYFYEGNDLNNNRHYLRKHFPGGVEGASRLDDEALGAFVRNEVDEYLGAKSFADLTLTLPLMWNALSTTIQSWTKALFRRDRHRGPPVVPDAAAIRPHTNLALVAGEQVELPLRLQSPALELSSDELALTLRVTRHALALLAERYPHAQRILVRLPSPIGSYEIVTEQVHVQTYHEREAVYATRRIAEHGREIGDALASIAVDLGFDYLDLTPALREAARDRLIHGPGDWKHLNEAGYIVVGEAVAARIAAGQAVEVRP